MFKHCNIELPPHAIYYFSKYTYYFPPSTPFIFYNPHAHLSLALALALSLSLKGKGMLAKESSQLTALRYSTMLSSSSLALSLSLNGHNSHHLTISIFHKVTTASY